MRTTKYFLLAILLWLNTLAASGQITLNTVEKYSVGNTYAYWTADTTNFNTGSAGANVVWDFNYLQKQQTERTGEVLLPSQTLYERVFKNANEVRKDSDGNFLFLDRKKDTVFMTGFRQNNTNINIFYTKPQLFAINPLAYNDSDVRQTEYTYSFGGQEFVGGGTFKVHADGYGKLILDGKTYDDVLRVKIEQNNADTIKQFGSIVSQSFIVGYRWYNKYNGIALLSIDSVIVQSQNGTQRRLEILMLKSPIGSVGINHAIEAQISAVINYDKLEIAGLKDKNATSIEVYDIAGRLMTSKYNIQHKNKVNCQLPMVAKTGQLFIIKINTTTKTHTLKLGVR